MYCDKCGKAIFDDNAYCLTCLKRIEYKEKRPIYKSIHFIKNSIYVIKRHNKNLEERVQKLEKLIQEMLYYAPSSQGYQDTKEHFEEMNK